MRLALLFILVGLARAELINQSNKTALPQPSNLQKEFETFKAQTEAQLQVHRDALAGIIVIMRTYLTSAALVDRVTLNFHQKHPDSPAQKMYESDMAFAEAKRKKESEEALAQAQAYWDELCKHDTPPKLTEPSVFWLYCKGLVEVDGKLVPISEIDNEPGEL